MCIRDSAGGLEKTQGLLAGKYATAVQKALAPAKTAQYAPLAYGLIGAGGSVAGNVLSGEDKSPGQILAEAAGAGALGATLGGVIGRRGQASQVGRANYPDIAAGYGEKALPYIQRAAKATEAGALSTAEAAAKKAAGYGNKILDAKQALEQKIMENRVRQGLAMATLPVAAGLGGLMGGQIAGMASSLGVPGFQQDGPIDPEHSLESSNTMRARHPLTTMQYGV